MTLWDGKRERGCRALTHCAVLHCSAGSDADGETAGGPIDRRASRPALQRQLPQPAPLHPRHAPGALEEQTTRRLSGEVPV